MNVVRAAALWLCLMLAMLSALSAHAARISVPPDVGNYNYGFVRCDTWHNGYSSRATAETTGANYYYNSGCGATVTTRDPWATSTSPAIGCGGGEGFPRYFLGVETSNYTGDFVTYKSGSTCSSTSTDGLSLQRFRPVSCSNGYTPNAATNLCDPPVGVDLNKNNKTCPAGCNGTDPINSATGALIENEVDFVDPGNLLNLERFYTSVNGQFDLTNLGPQWRNDFDRRISVITSGSLTVATAYRANGDRYHFSLNASGQWVPDLDVAVVLTSSSDSSGNITGWTLFDTDGTLETYDLNGYLVGITMQDERSATLTYSGVYLSQVTDERGRSLKFVYGPIAYQALTRLTQVNVSDGSSINYHYDSGTGMLTSVAYTGTVNGQAVTQTKTYVYAENGAPTYALTGVVDESGQRYSSWSYDAQGRATLSVHGSFTDFAGRTVLTYNSNGTTSIQNWIDGTLGLSLTRQFSFNVIQGVAHFAAVTCISCTSAAIQLPGFPALPASSTFDIGGYPYSSTDYKGNLTATQFDDTYGLLVQQVDASGSSVQRTTNITWDTAIRKPLLREVQDPQGHLVAETEWVYNSLGEVTFHCEIDPAKEDGYICNSGSSGGPPAGVRRWTYDYCTAVGSDCPLVGLLRDATGPYQGLTPFWPTTTYSYYPSSSAIGCGTPGAACYMMGDLYQVTDALGHVTTYASYDGAGRVTRITDANGVNTDMTYTPRGWLQSRSVGGATTSFTYWPYGAVETVTDPDGITTTFTYDGAHRLTDIKDMQGNDIHYTLDAAGNKTNEQISTFAGTVVQSLTHTYNTLGQLTGVIDGLSHTVFNANASGSYDANGNLVLASDALGIQRQQGFDALNRLTTTIANYNGTDPVTANTQTTVNHDALNRVTTVTDPSSLITGYTYDGLSNLTNLQSPDTGTSGGANGDQYDAAGNRTQHTDARGVVTQYTYDLLNRLTGTIYPAHTGLNVTYTYDQLTPISGCPNNFNIGHLTSMTDASGTTAWCYTNQGDVREVKQVINGFSYLHGYAYTAGRRLLYLQYPSGFEVQYQFDADGRVSTIGYLQQPGPYGSYTNSTLTPLITAVSYEPFGPVSGYSWAQGGQSVTRTYDQNYALTDITSAGSPQPLALHFARDTMGRIGAEGTAPGAIPASESYQYDPLNRLKELDNSAGALEQKVTYNPTGDRSSQTLAGQSPVNYGYQAGTHQLTSVGTAQRLPDANGNTTAMIDPNGDLIGLGYDDRNLLTTVTRSGSTIGAYQYNGLGMRVWRTITSPSVGQAATVYDPTGTGNLYGEYFAADYREYVYLDGIPVASATDAGRAAPGINYLYADQLGSMRAVLNPQGQGTYQWPWLNNAFGASLAPPASFYTRFPGQYFDVETGLEYNGNRYYDSSVARYLQSDPIGLNGGISTYVYGGNNPLSHVDPLGLRADTDLCTGMTAQGCMQMADFTPDYTQVSYSWYIFSGNLSATGDSLFGSFNVSRNYTDLDKLFQGSVSADIGFVNSTCEDTAARRRMADQLLNGFSMSAGAYFFAGGSEVYSPGTGTATEIGVGMGVNVTPAGIGYPIWRWGTAQP